ncbi:MAG: hypothetical protein IBX55_01375 [Methyloprofundus sp.]|nr:hypothetical protein [Methyloprofundus sp.]
MKVLVVSKDGRVGKSAIAREVFYANMKNNPLYVEIESLNESTSDYSSITNLVRFETLNSENIKDFFVTVADHKGDVVADGGASEIHAIQSLLKDQGFLVSTFFDLIVIPLTLGSREVRSFIDISTTLIESGMKPDSILPIVNFYDRSSKLEEKLFSPVKKFGLPFIEDDFLFLPRMDGIENLSSSKLSSLDFSEKAELEARKAISENKGEKNTSVLVEIYMNSSSVSKVKEVTPELFSRIEYKVSSLGGSEGALRPKSSKRNESQEG